MSCPSSIWHRNSNPEPLEHESSPITTRPGLPPIISYVALTLETGRYNSRQTKSLYSGQNEQPISLEVYGYTKLIFVYEIRSRI